MATLENLQSKIAKLQMQVEAIVKKDSSVVVAKIRDLMEKHGLTTADIDAYIGAGKMRGRKAGVKSAAKSFASTAKYRDPKTGSTWTGHGRAPAWIANAKDRTKFLVDGSSAAASPIGKPTARAGNYVRGIQPALYVDPKTGATWSGRGRAPAWLGDVKDRSKFLISKAGEGKAEQAAAEKKAVPVKKPASKNAGAKANVAKKARAAKKVVASEKAVAKKASAASQKAATKKTAALPTRRAAVKKVAATKSVADKAVVTKAEPAATPAAPAEVSA
ncbi:H-NS histone family protein [Paraburkholderia caribensis]|uniref:H-NS histone family protein n=1 Tax=Paraburkholderia caribensis TaxID=75105 RepID=UPI001D096E08|nr:H-NS family nucleoid-associated regulatory protein [Paraburkholderia caribensis]